MWLRLLFDGHFVANSHIFCPFQTDVAIYLRFVFAGIYNILCNIGGRSFFSFFVANIRHTDVLRREHYYGLALSAGKEVVDRVLR